MGAGTNNPLRYRDSTPLPVTTVDPALGVQRGAIRDRDFPPTAAPLATPAISATVFQPIVDAMVAMGEASRERDDARETCRYAEVAEKVSPSHIWESGIGTLRRLCQVAHDAALPPIWTRLARLGIKHGRRVLEAAAQEPPADRTFSLPVVGRPVISPELSRAVTSLHFCRVWDDMDGCLSMFSVSYPDQASVAAVNERNGLYDQQTSGAALPSWGDLLDSKKSWALQLPVDWFQLRLVFLAFHRFLQILLGKQHIVPLGILNLFTVMEDLAASDLYKAMDGAKQCAELMTAVDVYTWSWVDQQERSPTPVTLEYGLLAQELRLRKWKPPDLPAILLAALKPVRQLLEGDLAAGPPQRRLQPQQDRQLSTRLANRGFSMAASPSTSLYKWPHRPRSRATKCHACITMWGALHQNSLPVRRESPQAYSGRRGYAGCVHDGAWPGRQSKGLSASMPGAARFYPARSAGHGHHMFLLHSNQ
jgi:hypothetical protein